MRAACGAPHQQHAGRGPAGPQRDRDTIPGVGEPGRRGAPVSRHEPGAQLRRGPGTASGSSTARSSGSRSSSACAIAARRSRRDGSGSSTAHHVPSRGTTSCGTSATVRSRSRDFEQLAGLGQIGRPRLAALVHLAEPLRLDGDGDPPGDQLGQLRARAASAPSRRTSRMVPCRPVVVGSGTSRTLGRVGSSAGATPARANSRAPEPSPRSTSTTTARRRPCLAVGRLAPGRGRRDRGVAPGTPVRAAASGLPRPRTRCARVRVPGSSPARRRVLVAGRG